MARNRVQTVRGYGARLRERLRSAGMTQAELARAADISRQTLAHALRDRVSSTTAKLIEDVLQGTRVRSRSSLWATATQLAEWAGRREAQEDLPRLIRRLVAVTAPDATRAAFPAGEGIQRPGLDGIVSSSRGSLFVPQGDSVWELGTNADPAAKAEEDYEKRANQLGAFDPAATTFVFVTPRRWIGKDSWRTTKHSQRLWREVRVYDADDLEAWLEDAPTVHSWLSLRIGVAPTDCQDLESWWETWRRATEPALSTDVLLSGRDEACTEITRRLSNSERSLAVRAESQDEAIAFFAASLHHLGPAARDAAMARAIVVRSDASWRHLVASRHPLVLIPTFDIGEQIAAAFAGGHTVVFPRGAGDDSSPGTVEVGPVLRERVVELLASNQQGPREREWELASLARRSMTAFRRSIGVPHSFRSPPWAQPAHSHRVLGALLLGSWNDAYEGDRSALALLSGCSYEDAVATLAPFTNTTDPLLRRRGGFWYLVSTHDAWRVLGRFVTQQELRRFETVAIETLGAIDPRYSLEPQQRWMAGILLPPRSHSDALRRGITRTLAFAGALEDTMPVEPGKELVAGCARGVVSALFQRAYTDARLWASLSNELPDLAESAPSVFLREVDSALSATPGFKEHVFPDDSQSGVFGPTSPHVYLLWALERLAWSSRYMPQVVRILGKLLAFSLPSRTANRPEASLRSIFLPWLPQTSATVAQRCDVLLHLTSKDPLASARVLLSMLPEHHGVGHYSATPQWHDWKPEPVASPSQHDYWHCVHFAAAHLVSVAGSHSGVWADVIAALPRFPEPEFSEALDKLRHLDPASVSATEGRAIWDGLRTLVGTHRSFADASWALSPEKVDRLEELRGRFAPIDLPSRFAWLFGHRPELPDARARYDDLDAYHAALQSERTSAISTILTESGIVGAIEVAAEAKDPHSLGYSMGRLGPLPDEDAFLSSYLSGELAHVAQLAWGYLIGRCDEIGAAGREEWLLQKFRVASRDWEPSKRAALLLAMRATPPVWKEASADTNVASAYWHGIGWHWIDREYVEEAIPHLLAYQRYFTALALVSRGVENAKANHSTVLDVLERCTFHSASDKADSLFSHNVECALDALGDVVGDAEVRVARLELALLPVLSRYERPPRTLTRLIMRDPSLFVDAVRRVYKPRHADAELPEASPSTGEEEASQAFEMLRSLRGIPGHTTTGAVDAAALRDWVMTARTALDAADRLAVGMNEIGQLLGSSPQRGDDGYWPHEAIRSLLEDLESDDLERGLLIGALNSRPVTSRAILAGGGPERAMARALAQDAVALEAKSPRTAQVLHHLAGSYAAEARHHDYDVDVREDLGD